MEITWKGLARGGAKAVKGGAKVAKAGASKASQFKADILSDSDRYADVPALLTRMADEILSQEGKRDHEVTAAHGIKIFYKKSGTKFRIKVGGNSKVEGVKAALDKAGIHYEPSSDSKCVTVSVLRILGHEDD